jgi:hypothetical protein
MSFFLSLQFSGCLGPGSFSSLTRFLCAAALIANAQTATFGARQRPGSATLTASATTPSNAPSITGGSKPPARAVRITRRYPSIDYNIFFSSVAHTGSPFCLYGNHVTLIPLMSGNT